MPIMNRRQFLSIIAVAVARQVIRPMDALSFEAASKATPVLNLQRKTSQATDDTLRDYLYKMKHFDEVHASDILLTEKEIPTARSVMQRLMRLQSFIGYGNFQLTGMDEAIRLGRTHSSIGQFSREELAFLEEFFYKNASLYGFNDIKPLTSFTYRIDAKRVFKVPGMGNYIFAGEAQKTWNAIQAELGPSVVLTSGVRGVAKQFLLFLNKAMKFNGNLSLASRSLAPPGYSFHGVGDFDVGQKGFGLGNFSKEFIRTPVFRTLSERGYLTLRYPEENLLGVRYEPWHVKVKREGYL